MKILHLVPSIGPGSGGMGTATLATFREQRQAGIDSSIWCVDPPDVARAAARSPEVFTMPVVGPRRFAFSPAGERRARRTAADLSHQHGLWTAQARVTDILRTRGIPTVLSPHGSLAPFARRGSAWKKRLALAWFESRNLRLASCLHATSEAEVSSFRDFGLRGPVAVIPHGVSPSWLTAAADPARFRSAHGIGSGTRVMLFLSRVHPIKGLPMLVEALAMERDRLHDWCMVVAGPDAAGHRAAIEGLAERMEVSRLIRFVGPLFDSEKRDAFAAAEVFVLPTHTENFGIVIVEALACGVPVLTTRGAPWGELEVHDCGWWVPIDSRSIAAGLAEAAGRSAEELRAMGARGRELVASCYLWPAIGNRTIGLYRWLLGQAERPDFVVVD